MGNAGDNWMKKEQILLGAPFSTIISISLVSTRKNHLTSRKQCLLKCENKTGCGCNVRNQFDYGPADNTRKVYTVSFKPHRKDFGGL